LFSVFFCDDCSFGKTATYTEVGGKSIILDSNFRFKLVNFYMFQIKKQSLHYDHCEPLPAAGGDHGPDGDGGQPAHG